MTCTFGVILALLENARRKWLTLVQNITPKVLVSHNSKLISHKPLDHTNMKNIRIFYLKIFNFLVVKFSIYLNRHVFVMPDLSSVSFPLGEIRNYNLLVLGQ